MIPLLLAATPSERVMSLVEHLDELRSALLRAAVVVLLLVGVAWFFSDRLLDALVYQLLHGERALALSPTEAFSARIEIALWTGGAAALPYLLFELWRFVAPGLERAERRFAVPWMAASAILLYAGVAFAVALLLPMLVSMLQAFATSQVESRVSLLALLHFAVKLAAGCGLLFQMPLVLCLLAWFGIASPRALARQWRHAVLLIALAAALVTPGDGPSMILLAAPLVVLYFASLAVAALLWRARWKDRAEPGRFA